MGLSHLIQPQLWVLFFQSLHKTGLAAIIIPLYTLPFGLALIATHNIWVLDWPIAFTIAGWMMTLKSALYLLIPGAADRMLAHRIARTPMSYRVVGSVTAVIAAVLTWQAWTHR